MSANLMLREVGLVLFLASVGIKAGENFVQMVVEGDGVLYVGLGFLITFIPLLITGIIARWGASSGELFHVDGFDCR